MLPRVETVRLPAVVLGTLLMTLAMLACSPEGYEATKAVEDATKEVERATKEAGEEAEKALEELRKSVDDLPNCDDAREVVYVVEWKQGKDYGRGYLSKIENYRTLDVEIQPLTATVRCAGEAWRKDGRYIGQIEYWVRKNKRDAKGTHYAGYEHKGS